MADYIVEKIQTKSGKLQFVHEEMLGRPAYIVDLEVGRRGVLKVLPECDDKYHTIRTSPVVAFTSWGDNEKTVEIETQNTRYTLRHVDG